MFLSRSAPQLCLPQWSFVVITPPLQTSKMFWSPGGSSPSARTLCWSITPQVRQNPATLGESEMERKVMVYLQCKINVSALHCCHTNRKLYCSLKIRVYSRIKKPSTCSQLNLNVRFLPTKNKDSLLPVGSNYPFFTCTHFVEDDEWRVYTSKIFSFGPQLIQLRNKESNSETNLFSSGHQDGELWPRTSLCLRPFLTHFPLCIFCTFAGDY